MACGRGLAGTSGQKIHSVSALAVSALAGILILLCFVRFICGLMSVNTKEVAFDPHDQNRADHGHG